MSSSYSSPWLQSSVLPRNTAYHDSDNEDAPPPFGGSYHEVNNETDELGTQASVGTDGRVNVRIRQKTRGLSELMLPALQSRVDLVNNEALRQSQKQHDEAGQHPAGSSYSVPDRLRDAPLPLNVVIHVVGTRGDVQPFVALAKVLKADYGHRVRLATHPVYRSFVEEHGLEFFSIGGDPTELMSFMVKNPGMMPGFETLRNGDVGKRRKGIGELVRGCWRSCIETGDGTGVSAVDQRIEEGAPVNPDERPFVADCIIANPVSYAHIHCAEKLGVPLHMSFSMPWSPTQAFPSPLANIQATNADPNTTNYISYSLVEILQWQGLGDVINDFRKKSLGLEPISVQWAPGMLARLHIPWTYFWSPALIPKPADWGSHIKIPGFYFLSLANNYTPEPDLQQFLDSGPAPIYVGFGSIVVDDPTAMTKMIFEAIRKTGRRALVSKGWGGIGADELGKPEGVFMLGNVPHDWLFPRVDCVVHHGGAGTVSAGIAAGKPTFVVPFFGDQPFWGAMVYRSGAGPKPIPYKDLTADLLAESITKCLQPEVQEKAQSLSRIIAKERGQKAGAESFQDSLDLDKLRCTLAPKRPAVWRIRRTQIRLSTFAATVLLQEHLLESTDIKLYRSREYEVEEQPWEPITGGASALVGTMGTVAMSIADMPVQTLKALRIHPASGRSRAESHPETPAGQVDKGTGPAEGTSEVISGDTTPNTGRALSEHDDTALGGNSHKRHTSGNHRYDVLGALHHARTPSPSRSPAPGRSRTNSGATRPRSKSIAKEVVQNHFDITAVTDTGKGIYKLGGALTKSPMEFTMNVARGFHNAPKLYGDEVRSTERITDFSSGVRAAAKGFAHGFGDGIAGLVTQPMEGARKEGAVGFLKGFGKGIGGVVLKPGAAVWGLPAYTSKGIYMELFKRYGANVDNYILASRTAQGLEDVAHSSPEERAAVVKHYKELRPYIRRKKNIGEDQIGLLREKTQDLRQHRKSMSIALGSKFGHKSRSPSPHRAATTTSTQPAVPRVIASAHDRPYGGLSRVETRDSIVSPPGDTYVDMNPLDHIHTEPFRWQQQPTPLKHAQTMPVEKHSFDRQEEGLVVHSTTEETAHHDHDLETAIRKSLADSSHGDVEEDALVERAIRASVAELEASQHNRDLNDSEMQAAMHASAEHAKRDRELRFDDAREWAGGHAHAHFDGADHDEDEDERENEELNLALQESRKSYHEGLAKEEADRRDEETVIRYMQKQSLAEEEMRRSGGGGR